VLRLALVLLIVATAPNATTSGAIVAVGPNPVAMHDRGEYLILEFPAPTALDGWTITDGETVVALPDQTVSGRIVLTGDPALVEPWVAPPVLAYHGRLALANAGEVIELRRDGQLVDRVAVGRAPEGFRYVKSSDGWVWRREGTTSFAVSRAGPSTARVFVLPDAPHETERVLATARDRIHLGAYTFTSREAAAILCRARARGVNVSMVVDGAPVGGLTRREASVLDRLAGCGVELTVLGGPYARFAFHHAKYAVVDDRVLVMTENWKPSGSGGRSNRGWGVVIESRPVADALAAVFDADTGWRDGSPWTDYRIDREFDEAGSANGTFRAVHPPTAVRVDAVSLLVTPDNAEGRLLGLLDNATDSIAVQQVTLGRPGNPLRRAILRAARRGVRVRLLLSGAWYARAENRDVAEALRELSRRESLPLEVRVANPAGRFGKLHSKGIVIDGDQAVVGSINWNNNSLRRNREVAVVLHGTEAGAYYTEVFLGDWRGGLWRITVGLIGLAVITVVGGSLWARDRFVFDPEGLDAGRRSGSLADE